MEPSKEKTPPGGHGPPGDTALNCPTQSEHPLREHGRSAYQTPEPPAPCRTPHSSGKPLHLTSSSSRAFLLYLRHGLRKPNAAGVWGVGHGAQNSLLAIAHRILTAATPFCSLFPPLAALANVPASLSAAGAIVATLPPLLTPPALIPTPPSPLVPTSPVTPVPPSTPPRGFQRRGPQASPLVVSRGSRGEIRNPPGNLSWEARGDILLI